MYGPDVAILLAYGSHNVRHPHFRRLTVVNGRTPGLGRHTASIILSFVTDLPVSIRSSLDPGFQ